MTDLSVLPKVIGTKQTIRALEADQVKVVILADDIDGNIKSKIQKAIGVSDVKIITCESKSVLGKASGIERDAAVVAVLK